MIQDKVIITFTNIKRKHKISADKGEGVADVPYAFVCHGDHIEAHGDLCTPSRLMQVIQGCAADPALFLYGDGLFGLPVSAGPAVFDFYKHKNAVFFGNDVDLPVPVTEIPGQDLHPFILKKTDRLFFAVSSGLASGGDLRRSSRRVA